MRSELVAIEVLRCSSFRFVDRYSMLLSNLLSHLMLIVFPLIVFTCTVIVVLRRTHWCHASAPLHVLRVIHSLWFVDEDVVRRTRNFLLNW